MFKSKKADESLIEEVIFIALNILFFAILFYFVFHAASGTSLVEEVYAKRIAFSLDQILPGSTITLPVDEIYKTAQENKFVPEIKIENNQVSVKLARSSPGYKFPFLTDYNPIFISDESRVNKNELDIIIKNQTSGKEQIIISYAK